MELHTRIALVSGAAFAILTFGNAQAADGGLYFGGGVGTVALEAVIDDGGVVLPNPPPTFDEDDLGWKVMGGYNFALGTFSLGLEGSYVNLGAPSMDIATVPVEIESTALAGYGTAGLDFGPLGIFGKYGVVSWDADAIIDGASVSDDGTDPAYGIGARLYLGSFEFRGEYEIFDIEDTEDVSMVSLGLVWRF